MSTVGYHHCRWWELIRDNRQRAGISLDGNGKGTFGLRVKDYMSFLRHEVAADVENSPHFAAAVRTNR
jgi:hypothetical protein